MTRSDAVSGFRASDWSSLGAMVSGGSAIDLPRLDLPDEAAAKAFLAGYGLDPDNDDDRADLARILPLSRQFMEEVLLPWQGLEALPAELPDRPVALLLSASRLTDPMRFWSCSVLRVAHAVAHALFLPGRDKVTEALAQVEGRFRRHLTEADGQTWLGPIPLHAIRFKSGKPWNSLLLKLLCKKDNVAEEIYDHLGVRIVTRTRVEALEVVRYLRDHHVVPFPNVKPSRSHNSLLDLEALERHQAALWQELEAGRIDLETFERRLRAFAAGPDLPPARRRNPFSDEDRRAIQFTARLLVRREAEGRIERFFFPFEVQIQDALSWEESQRGRSSHEEYRERQREDARRRVFPWARSLGPDDVARDGASTEDQIAIVEDRILSGGHSRDSSIETNAPA